MTHKEIYKLANELSNEDLCLLMDICGDRFEIYLGKQGRVCVMTTIESVVMNGPCVQINTTLDIDGIREDTVGDIVSIHERDRP